MTKRRLKMFECEGAILRAPSEIEIERLNLDEPMATEVVVELRATGICHTDYARYNGDIDAPLPIVLGHEGAGIVHETGESVRSVKPGDSVVLFVIPSCGMCQNCSKGRPSYCPHGLEVAFSGTMPDGTRRIKAGDEVINHFCAQSSLATKAVVPERSVVKVPSGVSLESVSLLACGVGTGIGSVMNLADVSSGESVAIFGCGGVGAGAVLAADAISAGPIITIDVVDDKLEKAESLGATHTINANTCDPNERVKAITGDGVDYAFEFTGVAEVMMQAYEAAKFGGMVVITGESKPGPELSLDAADFLKSGKTIVANQAGSLRPQYDIPRYVKMYQNGNLDLDSLVTATYGFRDTEQAFADFEDTNIRSVVTFD